MGIISERIRSHRIAPAQLSEDRGGLPGIVLDVAEGIHNDGEQEVEHEQRENHGKANEVRHACRVQASGCKAQERSTKEGAG